LDALRNDGSVEITPDGVGYRSAFVGAVLLTLPGGRIYGSPPVFTLAANPRKGTKELDTTVTYEGDLASYRTVEQRAEQATLRSLLLGSAQEAECALCGRVFPVRYVRAAHIKPRNVCTEFEKRDLSGIAMVACLFGCDALFESGQVAVNGDGAIIVARKPTTDGLGDILNVLVGRIVASYSLRNADYFRWHHENKFLG
jgi:hypothetical protein